MSLSMDYVGPEGEVCSHYEIAPNRVACGYDIVRQHAGERHAFARTLNETTCVTCRQIVEREIRHTSVVHDNE